MLQSHPHPLTSLAKIFIFLQWVAIVNIYYYNELQLNKGGMVFLGHEIWVEGSNHGHVEERVEFLLKNRKGVLC